MSERLISVIIPVYNSEKFLPRCLDSVLKNTYKKLEVILVNDGSTDNSGVICDRYAKIDNRVKVIHQSNKGTAAARNKALSIANGEYIAFADNDDFIHQDFYKIACTTLENTNADMVICELTRDMDYECFFSCDYSDVCPEILDKHDFIKNTYTINWTRNTVPWNKLYKKILFSDIRFPVGKGYEDAYTTYKLIYSASRIAYVNAPLYYWYKNSDSYSEKKNNPKKLFYREEAIKLQTNFYKDGTYNDVKTEVRRFYLRQLYIMYYQLLNDYRPSDELNICIKKMKSKLTNFYFSHPFLLNKKESFMIFEKLHPVIGGVINKLFNVYKIAE